MKISKDLLFRCFGSTLFGSGLAFLYVVAAFIIRTPEGKLRSIALLTYFDYWALTVGIISTLGWLFSVRQPKTIHLILSAGVFLIGLVTWMTIDKVM